MYGVGGWGDPAYGYGGGWGKVAEFEGQVSRRWGSTHRCRGAP
jgi:hypothetical protein